MIRAEKPKDRRKKFRFPIHRDLAYKVLVDDEVVASGTGRTINLSSGGIAFETDRALPGGSFIELSISWPVLLDQCCPMRLAIFGRVLRSDGRRSACLAEKYEFRTQARSLPAERMVRGDWALRQWADGMRKEAVKTAVMGA